MELIHIPCDAKIPVLLARVLTTPRHADSATDEQLQIDARRVISAIHSSLTQTYITALDSIPEKYSTLLFCCGVYVRGQTIYHFEVREQDASISIIGGCVDEILQFYRDYAVEADSYQWEGCAENLLGFDYLYPNSGFSDVLVENKLKFRR